MCVRRCARFTASTNQATIISFIPFHPISLPVSIFVVTGRGRFIIGT
jgi:hypothetical protein